MRPTLTTSIQRLAFASIAVASLDSSGRRRSSNSVTAARCIAVGKLSLEDWPILTSSFGPTGCWLPSVPPSSWIARFDSTSLTFMFDWVPEPVCQTKSGKCASSAPEIASSAARTMASAFHCGRRPASAFTSAAAFLTVP